jgi:hypothetical protein
MATTKGYLHLAGVVFREEAQALEDRLVAGTTLYQPDPISADLSEHETPEQEGRSTLATGLPTSAGSERKQAGR